MTEITKDPSSVLEQLGVTAVRLDLPFRLNHVNCFIAEGEEGTTVIDTGLNNEYTRGQWKELLEGRNVSEILVTHYHPDHFGYAGGLQQLTGARVTMSEIDAKAGAEAWQEEFIDALPVHYKASGIPEETTAQMIKNLRSFQPLVNPLPEVTRFFKEGETFRIGNFDYEVIFTPGHSDGMVCFFNHEHSVLFSADHILPKITPNISYWFHGNDNPLGSYFEALKKMKRFDAQTVIPSHGKPFAGANKRIDELLHHHDERLEETLQAIAEPRTVHATCEILFQRELSVHETRFAIGESLAHLEFLRHAGACERENKDGIWYYVKK